MTSDATERKHSSDQTLYFILMGKMSSKILQQMTDANMLQLELINKDILEQKKAMLKETQIRGDQMKSPRLLFILPCRNTNHVCCF